MRRGKEGRKERGHYYTRDFFFFLPRSRKRDGGRKFEVVKKEISSHTQPTKLSVPHIFAAAGEESAKKKDGKVKSGKKRKKSQSNRECLFLAWKNWFLACAEVR